MVELPTRSGLTITPAPLQRLRSLERLESLDIAYVDVGTYSMRLHTVRLTELLYLPRLRKLCLAVPGLHDDVDTAAFLGVNFMRQLREGCLEGLDITLLSEGEGELPASLTPELPAAGRLRCLRPAPAVWEGLPPGCKMKAHAWLWERQGSVVKEALIKKLALLLSCFGPVCRWEAGPGQIGAGGV